MDQGGVTGKEISAEEALLVVSFLTVWIKAFLLVPISHPQQKYLLHLTYKFPLSNCVFHICTTNHRALPTSENHTAFLQTGTSGAPLSPDYFLLQTTAVFF